MVATRAIASPLIDAAAKKIDYRDSVTVRRYIEAEAGGPVTPHRYSPNGNPWLVRMEHDLLIHRLAAVVVGERSHRYRGVRQSRGRIGRDAPVVASTTVSDTIEPHATNPLTR
jgi:hypothetical protein